MKIAIIGCGAMGSYFAYKLAKNNEVICIDTFSEKVNKVKQEGITIIEGENKNTFYPKIYLNGQCDEEVDMILLFVKSTQITHALKSNQSLILKATVVLTLQNGLGNEEDIEKFVNPQNVIMGNTLINCVNNSLNSVRVSGTGITRVGSLCGNKLLSDMMCKLLMEAEILSESTDNIKYMIWKKIMVNTTLNPLCTIFDCTIGVIKENNYIWSILTRVVEECIMVAKFEGLEFNIDEVLKDIETTCENIKTGYPSMYQDIAGKRMTEIDKINGAIVKTALKHNVEVHYNQFITTAIKAIESMGTA